MENGKLSAINDTAKRLIRALIRVVHLEERIAPAQFNRVAFQPVSLEAPSQVTYRRFRHR